MSSNDSHSHLGDDDARLMQLVAMFQLAAMQQMGKLVNPVTNETERHLDQARASIDMLETIKRKTEGNRSEAETEFIDKVLFELHMNYVDEVDRDKKSGAGESGGATEDADSEPEPDDASLDSGSGDAAPGETGGTESEG